MSRRAFRLLVVAAGALHAAGAVGVLATGNPRWMFLSFLAVVLIIAVMIRSGVW